MPISNPSSPKEFKGLAFDIDGIVLDTATEMWKVITNHLRIPWTIDAWTDYDVGKLFGIPTRELRPIYEPVLRRLDLPPVDGAGVYLNKLFHKHQVPLLFITSRRAEFLNAAVKSVEKVLDKDVEFYVECTGLLHEEEFRNDKLELLQKYDIKLFVEDNWMYWEKYVDNNIAVHTLEWPWTSSRIGQMFEKGIPIVMHPDWKMMYKSLTGFLGGKSTLPGFINV